MKQRIYGIGVDVAFISRFQKTFEQFGERFLKRAYHPKEIEEFYSRPDPQRALYLASRWAVKEATYKAIQKYRLPFPEIQLCTLKNAIEFEQQQSIPFIDQVIAPPAFPPETQAKGPQLLFHGKTAALMETLSIVDPHVSISHDHDYAIAYVILQQEYVSSSSLLKQLNVD